MTGPWRTKVAPPCTPNELYSRLRARAERCANHTVVSCVPSVQSRLSVCSLPHACRLAFLSLVCQSARGAATPLQRRTLPSAFTGARSLFLSLGLCHPSFVVREVCFTREPNSTHHLSLTCFLDERIVRALHPACWVHASSRETLTAKGILGARRVYSPLLLPFSASQANLIPTPTFLAIAAGFRSAL